jgi:hypothetical protein
MDYIEIAVNLRNEASIRLLVCAKLSKGPYKGSFYTFVNNKETKDLIKVKVLNN